MTRESVTIMAVRQERHSKRRDQVWLLIQLAGVLLSLLLAAVAYFRPPETETSFYALPAILAALLAVSLSAGAYRYARRYHRARVRAVALSVPRPVLALMAASPVLWFAVAAAWTYLRIERQILSGPGGGISLLLWPVSVYAALAVSAAAMSAWMIFSRLGRTEVLASGSAALLVLYAAALAIEAVAWWALLGLKTVWFVAFAVRSLMNEPGGGESEGVRP